MLDVLGDEVEGSVKITRLGPRLSDMKQGVRLLVVVFAAFGQDKGLLEELRSRGLVAGLGPGLGDPGQGRGPVALFLDRCCHLQGLGE